jgi:maltooligosyltrehalose synthase
LITLFDTDNIDPDASADAPALRRLAVRRFEQLTPPLAAKSVEDTAFYRYGRLLSRNEVGSDPNIFRRRLQIFTPSICTTRRIVPALRLLATATHDHKRGEDVRARLARTERNPRTNGTKSVRSLGAPAYRLCACNLADRRGSRRGDRAGARRRNHAVSDDSRRSWPFELRVDQ